MAQSQSAAGTSSTEPQSDARFPRSGGWYGRTGTAVVVFVIGAIAGLLIGLVSFWADRREAVDAETWSWRLPKVPQGIDPAYQRLCEEAVVAVARVLEAHPDSPHAVSALGVACYVAHDRAGEVACWERCLVLEPGHALAYSRLIALAEQEADYPRVVELARLAEAEDPGNATYRGTLASALLHLQRNQEAKEALEPHVRAGRADADAYFVLGEACYQLQEPGKAKRYFEAAVALAPYDSAKFYSLARACSALGETELAARYRAKFQELKDVEMAAHAGESSPREQVRDAVHIPMRVSEILRHVGKAYRDAGDLEWAERSWLRAAELSPDDVESRQLLSTLCDRTGRLEESLEWVRALKRVEPDNRLHERNEGLLLSRLGRYDEAEHAFRDLCRREPTGSFAYAALAELVVRRRGDLAEAESLARRAAALEPTGPHLFLLASIAHQAGNLATARQAMEQALARDPDNPQYQQLRNLISQRRP